MDDKIIEAMKSGNVHLQSYDKLRRMFFADGQFEVWGKDYKDDIGSHPIEQSPDVEIALKALLGEKKA